MGFSSVEARQAIGAISGFVYQVDVTIHSWLSLCDNQRLELEQGEDIDVIAPALVDDEFDQHRLLVQVKLQSSNLTLRSVGAVSAIAHLAGHIQRNPSIDIRTRYLTTATPVRERPSPFSGSMTGIGAWTLCAQAVDDDRKSSIVLGIREVLGGVSKPSKGVDEDDWSSFKSRISSNDGMLSLVQRLEWQTQTETSEAVQQSCCALLVDKGLVTSGEDVLVAYDKLFAYVFRLLTKKGARQLTTEQLAVVVGDATSGLAGLVRSRLLGLEVRIEALETIVEEQVSIVDRQGELLGLLATEVFADRTEFVTAPLAVGRPAPSHGELVGLASALAQGLPSFGARIQVGLGPIDVHPPTRGQYDVDRPDVEGQLRGVVRAATWVHVVGTVRCGKTTLVRSVIDSHRCGWLRLRGMDDQSASLHLRNVSARILGVGAKPVAALPDILGDAGGVLVFDDVPDLTVSRRVLEVLEELAFPGIDGVTLLSISPFSLPAGIRMRAGVVEFRAPAFSADDCRRMMGAYGAPEFLTANVKVAKQLVASTRGHAERLRHSISILANHEWRLDAASVLSAFATDPADELRGDVLRQVGATVDSADARDLLFRLCIYDAWFDSAGAMALARVEPALRHPGLLLTQIQGTWVAPEDSVRWSVSAAIQPYGHLELDAESREGVHQAVAHQYLATGSVTPVEVGWVVRHFERGGDADSAGYVAFKAIADMLAHEQLDMDPGLVRKWADGLPQAMSIGTRLVVRAAQAAAVLHGDGDAVGAMKEVDKQYAVGNADFPGVTLAAFTLYYPLLEYDRGAAARWLAIGLAAASNLPGSVADWAPLCRAVWVHMEGARTRADVDECIRLLEAVGDDVRATWNVDPEFQFVSSIVTNQLWLSLDEIEVDDRDWSTVLLTLQRLENAGERCGLEPLRAAALATSCVIRAQELGQWQEAVAIAEGHEQSLSTAVGRATVADAIGRQFVFNETSMVGLSKLLAALELYPAHPAMGLSRVNCCMVAARAAWALGDMAQCVGLLRRGVGVAFGDEEWLPEMERVNCLVELAIGLWLSGNLREAWVPFSQAVRLLLRLGDQGEYWRDRFVLIGHVSGYFSSLASTGAAPPSLPNGEDRYAAPVLGMFFNRVKGRASLYKGETLALLPEQLVAFAEGIHNWKDALEWAKIAIDYSTAAGLSRLAFNSNRLIASQRFFEGDLEGALESVSAAVLTLEAVRMSGGDILEAGAPLRLEEVPTERWTVVAHWLRNLGVVPSVVFANSASTEELWDERIDVLVKWCEALPGGTNDSDTEELLDLLRSVRRMQAAEFSAYWMSKKPTLDHNTWAAGHLLAGRRASPIARAAHHIKFTQAAGDKIAVWQSIYWRAIVPVLVGEWQEFVEASGFQLRAPRIVRESVERLASAKEGPQLNSILLVVADGLGLAVDDRLRSWLQAPVSD